jgi:hypothetical protein
MNNRPLTPHQFILEAVDRERLCPVLQSIFKVTDLNALQAILGDEAADDPELLATYWLEADELNAINEQFHVGFQPELLGLPTIDISLFKRSHHGVSSLPYLAHTGYELPLLLDGRKKLAKMSDGYPPWNFPDEEIFDRWVLEGRLHKETTIEPFDRPSRRFEGLRTVYYTPKGEEWRIPATKLIWRAAEAAGGWNEYFERLEGMLFGYEDWQNDRWIEDGLRKGRFAGLALCCPVDAAGLDWLEASGFRALPPIDKPNLAIMSFDCRDEAAMKSFMLENGESAALVRFNVFGKVLSDMLDFPKSGPWPSGPWPFPSGRIPELNRNLLRSVDVLYRRSRD